LSRKAWSRRDVGVGSAPSSVAVSVLVLRGASPRTPRPSGQRSPAEHAVIRDLLVQAADLLRQDFHFADASAGAILAFRETSCQAPRRGATTTASASRAGARTVHSVCSSSPPLGPPGRRIRPRAAGCAWPRPASRSGAP
jgi:hypothetical protein